MSEIFFNTPGCLTSRKILCRKKKVDVRGVQICVRKLTANAGDCAVCRCAVLPLWCLMFLGWLVEIFSMSTLWVYTVKMSNFKCSRSLLSILFERAARALFRPSSLLLRGVGIYDSKDRRLFSDLSQVSTISEHGFYVRVSWTST